MASQSFETRMRTHKTLEGQIRACAAEITRNSDEPDYVANLTYRLLQLLAAHGHGNEYLS